VALSSDDYLAQLMALAPVGTAMPQDLGSVWVRLLRALADGMADVDARADNLLDEADPRTALEMLSDYERVCGLPDGCTGAATTLQERRSRVVSVWTARGGQSRAYFQRLAEGLGYAVTIDEFRPFITGLSRCGDTLNGAPTIRHTWRMRVHGPRVTFFRAGASACGDKLGAIATAEDLECILSRLAPAHTTLIFAYEEE